MFVTSTHCQVFIVNHVFRSHPFLPPVTAQSTRKIYLQHQWNLQLPTMQLSTQMPIMFWRIPELELLVSHLHWRIFDIIVDGLEKGSIGFTASPFVAAPRNMLSALNNFDQISISIHKETLKHMSGTFVISLFEFLNCSPLVAFPKRDCKFRNVWSRYSSGVVFCQIFII